MKTHDAKENRSVAQSAKAAGRQGGLSVSHGTATRDAPVNAIDDSPVLTAQRKLRQDVDSSPRQLAEAARLAGMFDGAPRQPSGGGTATVQRRIMFDGELVKLAALFSKVEDKHARTILMNWGKSGTEHDFVSDRSKSAEDKLFAAVKSAQGQSPDPGALYKAANLKFLTKAEGRLPTLYFSSGNHSGRIRQQHGSGPVIIDQHDKVDYFFKSQAGMNLFFAGARRAMKEKKVFDMDVRQAGIDGSLTPATGDFHLEVTYAGEGRVAKVHPSGGVVDMAIEAYDDARIRQIYARAIGLA